MILLAITLEHDKEMGPVPSRNTTEWRALPPTTLDQEGKGFGSTDNFQLDPVLFPEVTSLKNYLGEIASPDRNDISEAAGYSLRNALGTITPDLTPQAIERLLRSHLGGILEQYVALEPVEAPRVIAGQYAALREIRFMQQIEKSIGTEKYEEQTNTILDGQGIDYILFGDYGVEGAVGRGRLHALQGFIVLVEGLINRNYQINSLKVSDEDLSRAIKLAGLEAIEQQVDQVSISPFTLIIAVSVGRDRAKIEELDCVGKARAVDNSPFVLLDVDWAQKPDESVRLAIGDSLRSLFPDSIFRSNWDKASLKGDSGYRSESEMILWLLGFSD